MLSTTARSPIDRFARLPAGTSAVVAGLALTTGLYAARVAATGHRTYGFLLYNLALGLVPWVLAWAVAELARRPRGIGARVGVVALGLAWLAFLPNAPYLVTDFVHLRLRPPAPLWYDTLLLATAAMTGIVAGACSLRIVHGAVCARFGSRPALALVVVAIPLSGLGIALGRFARLNSWDLVTHPHEVLATALHMTTSPRAVVASAATAGLFAIAVLAIAGPDLAPARRD